MARSVSTPRGVFAKVYLEVPEDYLDSSFEWEYLIEDLQAWIGERFPSLSEHYEWVGREDVAILANAHCKVGISEYCGVACIWLLPEDTPLGMAWCRQVSDAFINRVESGYPQWVLRRIGAFSNGEVIYERVHASHD